MSAQFLSQIILDHASHLTELLSIQLWQQIQFVDLACLNQESINTSYIRRGKGSIPILLLHGFDSNFLEFRRLVPLLAKSQEIWAIDILGFGFTSRNKVLTFSTEEIKEHLFTFCQSVIKKPVILVGASMGGATAIDFCLRYPECVEKLILIDSAGLIKQPNIGKWMFPPFERLATLFLANKWVRQKIAETAYFNPALANHDASICASLHLDCVRWEKALISFTKSGGYGSFLEQLAQIEKSTLIIWGKQDKILGTLPAEKFLQKIKHSKLIWLDGCGHVPHLEKPLETAQSILSFIQCQQ